MEEGNKTFLNQNLTSPIIISTNDLLMYIRKGFATEKDNFDSQK